MFHLLVNWSMSQLLEKEKAAAAVAAMKACFLQQLKP
jgi:hypothetical protein